MLNLTVENSPNWNPETLRLYERAMAATSCGIVISDAIAPNNPIIYCNPAFETITGYPPEEVIGRNCKFLQGHDTDPAAVATIRHSIATRQECKVTIKNYRKDGTPFWNELVISPVHDATGQLTHFVGIQTDITHRQQAETALKRNEELYRTLAKNLPNGAVLLFDQNLRYLVAEGVELEKNGNKDIEGKSLQEVSPPDICQLFEPMYRAALKGKTSNCKYPYRDSVYQVYVLPVTNDQGEITAGMVMTHNITAVYQAQRAAQRSNAFFKAQQEASLDGTLVVDEQRTIVSYNAKFLEMWKIPAVEIHARDDRKLMDFLLAKLDNPQAFLQKVEYLYNQPYLSSRDEIVLKDGRVFDRYSAPVLGVEGEYYGKIWSWRDITEQKRFETTLQQQAERERLVGKISDRIRQSLKIEEVLKTTVAEVRNLLQCDRVVLYHFHPDWSGTVVVESVGEQWEAVLGQNIQDTCFVTTKAIQYQQGRIRAIDDIYHADLTDCHINLLEQCQVKANLVVPVLQNNNLWGLLIAHHCQSARHWQPSEIELLQQLSIQLSVAIQQAALFEQIEAELQERKQAELALRESETQLRKRSKQLEDTLYELSSTQAQLVQNEKMSSLGQLVAGIAHEINNPVSFICGNVAYASKYAQDLLELIQLYGKYYPQPADEIQLTQDAIDLEFLIEDFPKLLRSMQVGVERIQQIVISLRNFSRLDEADCKRVDIHEGIENTLMILHHRLKEQVPELQVIKNYGEIPFVECYPGQLNQVFMNLLGNAIDALEDSLLSCSTTPTILIHTELINCKNSENQNIIIRIKDNGEGIPEDLKTRIFDPFFTTKPVGKGTGLGLSISYQIIVEKHGGQLSCISEPGQGTEFIIEIPMRQSNTQFEDLISTPQNVA